MNSTDFDRIWSAVYGHPAWSVKKGHGSFLTLEFGPPALRIREPELASPDASERVRELAGRRLVTVTGSWRLWIYCCNWSIELNGKELAHSESPDDDITFAAEQLDGQKLLSVGRGTTPSSWVFAFIALNGSGVAISRTSECKAWHCLAAVLDLFTRRVVGWGFSTHPDADLVAQALEMAYEQRGRPQGLLFHPNQGGQYASRNFRLRQRRYRLQQSMSRRGNCWDNSPVERLLRNVKTQSQPSVGYMSAGS